ncbi:MAG TPA: bifunctional UDP-sugar hydrolase/5'-nucleotidase [Myxococcota bacterium]|nr:bifunctional UDP-sugar hydrolase/5'-nucleotidase [Myxococcota bacterium]
MRVHPESIKPAWRLAAGAFLLVLAACTVETEQPVIQGHTIRLTILRTSDIHSRLFPTNLKPNSHDVTDGLYLETSPYGGVERVAALVNRERQHGQRVVYIDSGDVFQGAPIFNYGDGEPEFRWMSSVGADVMVVGNHEFDKGAANLAVQAAHWITYPFLAANYLFEDWSDETASQLGRSVQPFVILNVKGLRVGVIGMGDIGSMYSITRGGNSLGITPIEANETLRFYVGLLGPAVDFVIVASHLGLSEDQELTNGHAVYLTTGKDLSAYLDRPVDPWVRMDCDECESNVAKYWVPGVRGIDAILGGHLHILTHPPMVLTDPVGRKVLLEHPGAFAKFVTRLDLAVAVPAESYSCSQGSCVVCRSGSCGDEQDYFSRGSSCTSGADCSLAKLAPYGAERISHQQQIFPIDSIWCTEPRPDPYDYPYGDNTSFIKDTLAIADYCKERGDARSRNLLQAYRVAMELDPGFILTQIYGYAPKSVDRKDTGGGGDSPLGDMTTLAMMRRKRVEAELCVTNTLGIRDNLYPGLIDMEAIFNSFPFENTITVMYLSGREIQELFNFVTERSFGRGCQSQAQISGASFVMNCGQAKRNYAHYSCSSPEDCCPYRPEICEQDYTGTARWECNQGACYSHPGEDIMIGGRPLNLEASYKLATNDYIAAGGSGFEVLRRNTTKVNTGVAMRDALLEYLRAFPTCSDLLAAPDPNAVDAFSLSFCREHESPQSQRDILIKGSCTCGDVLDFAANPDDPAVRAASLQHCDSIDSLVIQFCEDPLNFPIVVGESDGRITRKVN